MWVPRFRPRDSQAGIADELDAVLGRLTAGRIIWTCLWGVSYGLLGILTGFPEAVSFGPLCLVASYDSMWHLISWPVFPCVSGSGAAPKRETLLLMLRTQLAAWSTDWVRIL